MTIDWEEGKWVCGACACIGIKDLGLEKDAPSAMKTFCQLMLLQESTRYLKLPDYVNHLHAHYIFVAGPEEPGHFHSKRWTRYGTEFAEFIEANNLGKLATLGQILNERWHPGEGTTCQVWIWQPDRDALIRWWESQQTPQDIVVPPTNVPTECVK